jgi:hypothetical protein
MKYSNQADDGFASWYGHENQVFDRNATKVTPGTPGMGMKRGVSPCWLQALSLNLEWCCDPIPHSPTYDTLWDSRVFDDWVDYEEGYSSTSIQAALTPNFGLLCVQTLYHMMHLGFLLWDSIPMRLSPFGSSIQGISGVSSSVFSHAEKDRLASVISLSQNPDCSCFSSGIIRLEFHAWFTLFLHSCSWNGSLSVHVGPCCSLAVFGRIVIRCLHRLFSFSAGFSGGPVGSLCVYCSHLKFRHVLFYHGTSYAKITLIEINLRNTICCCVDQVWIQVSYSLSFLI